MRLLSVATVDYLYQAKVMIDSFKKFHPNNDVTIIVADATYENLKKIQPSFGSDIDLICIEQLGYDFLGDMRIYYSVLEFCSALKVLGLAHVLQAEKSCLFLDPDMLILESLVDSIFEQPGEIVVSCHTFEPYPVDDSLPNDLELILTGFINGGVLLARNGENGNSALDWLVKQTKYHWFVAPDKGMYADQQWLSALPFLFKSSTKVLSDRGVNVAYWNLHERPLSGPIRNSSITLNTGELLRLMHFSGFPSPANGTLTTHTSRYFDNETEGVLQILIPRYEKLLDDARLKFVDISGDIKFNNCPLDQRLYLASKRWGISYLYPQKLNLLTRFKIKVRNLINVVKS